MRTAAAFVSLWGLACQHVCGFVVNTPALRQQGRSSGATSALSMKAGPNPKVCVFLSVYPLVRLLAPLFQPRDTRHRELALVCTINPLALFAEMLFFCHFCSKLLVYATCQRLCFARTDHVRSAAITAEVGNMCTPASKPHGPAKFLRSLLFLQRMSTAHFVGG